MASAREGAAEGEPVALPRVARGVLFDLDGTLADTANDLAGALNVVRRELGLAQVDPFTLRAHASAGARGMLGAGLGVTPEDARYGDLRDRFLAAYARNIVETTRLFCGVDALLDALEGRGVAWGVVTNKATRFTLPVLDALRLSARASAVVCGDTTEHPKPHPAPLLHAAQQLGLHPGECVYVGDDLRDVLAGNAAGMATIVARWGYIGEGQDPAQWPASAQAGRPIEVLAYVKRG